MSEPFVGEIRAFAFNFAPQNWTQCDGATLTIQQNAALYSLINIQFGGDGRTNFKLPDMRGRTPMHRDYRYSQYATTGTLGGTETVVLTSLQIPAHTHQIGVDTDPGTTNIPTGNLLAQTVPPSPIPTPAPNLNLYADATNTATPPVLGNMGGSMVQTTGASSGHNNMQPYTVVNFCIATTGYYPQRP